MITDKFEEVFKVIHGYLTDESAYSPLVTKNAPLKPTIFPVVEVKSNEITGDTTTRDEEVINVLNITINIYAIEKVMTETIEEVETSYKVSGMQIANELIKLIDEAMVEMHFTLLDNREVENIDKNVYRRLLRYTAGVDTRTNKIIRRK